MALGSRTVLHTRSVPARRSRRTTFVVLSGILALGLVCVLALLYYNYRIERRLDRAERHAAAVEGQINDSDALRSLDSAGLAQLNQDLTLLEADLNGLEDQIDMPVVGSIAKNAPVISHKVKASQDLISLGKLLTGIARDATDLAAEVRTAFENTGFTTSTNGDGPTWLDVVRDNRATIDDLSARVDEARVARESLDEQRLTKRGKSALRSIDDVFARAEQLRNDYFHLIPLLDDAFGGEGDVRYLVLLQNSEELRNTGGFPGTYAMIAIRNGRVSEVKIDKINYLNGDYIAHRTEVLAPPKPIVNYLGVQEWIPHDALWSPDFAEAARQFYSMYQIAGWPEINGIIAINYSVVQEVLRITGPYNVVVNGDVETVSADTVIGIIDQYREHGRHKRVVRILGESLVQQLKATDFEQKKQIYESMQVLADQREIQAYLFDPALQAEIVQRGWHGPLDPEPGTPRLAMTVASLAGGKASPKVHVKSDLIVASNGLEGISHVTWHLTFDNRGDPLGDPKYEGFVRGWVSIYLPDGAVMTATSLKPSKSNDNPRAIGYNIGMKPGQRYELTIEFDLQTPATQLILRRQPGLNNIKFDISGAMPNCSFGEAIWLKEDYRISVADCSVRQAR
jgi:hypothetical protein